MLALTAAAAATLAVAVLTGGSTPGWLTTAPTTEGSGTTSTRDPSAPGAGTVELGAAEPRSEAAGTWSPGTEPGAAAVVPAGTAFPPNEPTCDTDGCAIWRSTVLDQRPLLVNERLAVHLGLELLIAVDIETGRWRWSRGHSDPRGVSPAAALTASHLDDRTLAIAYGHRLRIHDAETGRILGEVDLAPTEVTDIRRHEGQLVVIGRVRDGEERRTGGTRTQEPRAQEPRTRVIGLADDGHVRFDVEVARPVRGQAPPALATAPLLAVADDSLVRLDASTGEERWRRALDGRQLDGTTLLDRDTGEITVLGTSDGEELLRLVRPGAVAAGVRGGVLIVTFPERIELHDRDRTELGEVTVPPERTVVVTAGRQVTVATLPAAGTTDPQPQARIGRRAGDTQVTLPSITDSVTVPLPPGLEPAPVLAMRRGDGLVVAGPEPGWAWVVDQATAAVTPIELPLLPGSEVGHGDGLTIVRNGQQLTIIGAESSFGVRGVTQVASLDPLVVHGGNGTLRLDRSVVERRHDETG